MSRIVIVEDETIVTADLAKTQFLANMSHELRTPMIAILGMIDLALSKAIDPTVRDYLDTARCSADLLLSLLNDLLDSARIESGKLELAAAPFSLRRTLDQIMRTLAVRASEKELLFIGNIADDVPDALVGDRLRLQQILLNLAGNAIKFTESGEVEIAVRTPDAVQAKPRTPSATIDERSRMKGEGSTIEGTAPRRQSLVSHPSSGISAPCTLLPAPCPPFVTLEFSIRDTGIGISSEEQERLFLPFVQADASMARRFGGTGLGLAICKRLVEMMGGQIRVQSVLGEGSTFSFTATLPLTEELRDERATVAALPAAARPLHILVVEDHPANQKLIHFVLDGRGHRVEIAGEGEEAVYLCREHLFDVVLMDVQMPGMNGLEATAAIRRHEAEGRRVPVIAMTAHAMPGDRDRCLTAGMDGYLTKPVDFPQLIALVESIAGAISMPGVETRSASEDIGHSRSPASCASRWQDEQVSPAAIHTFNPELAIARCFDSEEMLRRMVQSFFTDVDELFPRMRAALEIGDLGELGRLGHRMKGTVVYLGAEAAKQAALRVEWFGTFDGGNAAEAAEAVTLLEHQCIALKAAIKRPNYLTVGAAVRE